MKGSVGLEVVVEGFVARVFGGGKVTVPRRLRELLGVEDGDYVRLGVVEGKQEEGKWIRKKVKS
ncbi:MAG: AbrB/MazE/SpoVT family DNA-binding domain-containing protein [Candidatus Bathyarchaeia archaeon]